MKHLDLFSGIGGFALAVDEVWPGSEHIFCELDPYCQALLKKRFEGSEIYGDIRKLKGEYIWQKLNERKMQGGLGSGENEIPKRSENTGETIPTETEKLSVERTELRQKSDGKKTEKPLSTITEESAYVAASLFEPSSTSTTKTTTDTLKEKSSVLPEHTDELLKQDFQIPTNCSVITATSPKPSTDNARTKGVQIDILTGGIPCQPASQAGKRRGTKDDRWLWGEAFRIIRETQPRFVILENVRGILTLESGLVFKSLLTEMESCGYETRTYVIPAVAVNALHRRDRVWFVANRKGNGTQGGIYEPRKKRAVIREEDSNAPDTDCKRSGTQGYEYNSDREKGNEGRNRQSFNRADGQSSWNQNWLEVATELCGVDDGLPAEVDGLKFSKAKHRVERLKALGNSIVPAVAIEIMKAIKLSS